MKLSTKGRHAVTAMAELALSHNKGPVTLADISDQQSISISYLEQLFAKLRQQGLVMGMRGPGGGYSLARPIREITIANILSAVDGAKRQSVEPAGGNTADSLLVWSYLSNKIYDYLDSITLADVVEATVASSSHKQAQEPGVRRTAAA